MLEVDGYYKEALGGGHVVRCFNSALRMWLWIDEELDKERSYKITSRY